jgi:trk system potassium uptake protein TrkH
VLFRSTDPEFRLGLAIVGGVSLMLFLRHWFGAYAVDDPRALADAGRALWGTAFTVLSFMTTTGFESADWAAARFWSGLTTPGTILIALALIGGGVATTAGGVKLLRIWALYLNTTREMDRLIHPNSVNDRQGANRRLRKQGAFIAWVFFMLFALVLMLVMAAFSALGARFETATILAVSALTNTGPLVQVAGDAPIVLNDLSSGARLLWALAMVLGRLELLAFIALLTSDLWESWLERR